MRRCGGGGGAAPEQSGAARRESYLPKRMATLPVKPPS